MPHILLVDDDDDLCKMLSYVLETEGYTVRTAPDGSSAIRQFHRQVPDIILLDLMLPMVDGMEVCWRIRAFSNVPIIIMSGRNEDIDIYRALQAGADDYITKPFSIPELLARIKIVLYRRSENMS